MLPAGGVGIGLYKNQQTKIWTFIYSRT